MNFKPESLARVHEQMAAVKAQSKNGFFTNYFRQELVGPHIFTAATGRSVLFVNDEHDFFRLYFFTTDPNEFEQMIGGAEFPGSVVVGYITRTADENVTAALQ